MPHNRKLIGPAFYLGALLVFLASIKTSSPLYQPCAIIFGNIALAYIMFRSQRYSPAYAKAKWVRLWVTFPVFLVVLAVISLFASIVIVNRILYAVATFSWLCYLLVTPVTVKK